MREDIQRVVIPRQRIAQRVTELAEQIVADHATAGDPHREITLIAILSGAMVFCADLMRQMPLNLRLGLLTVSSYPGASLRTQGAQLLDPDSMQRQLGDLRGRRVVLVDDILDSGGTLRLLLPMLRALGPQSLQTCVLLRKDRPPSAQLAVDYVGFTIPDEFVVGYGLDYDDHYRNLPDIVTLKPQALKRHP